MIGDLATEAVTPIVTGGPALQDPTISLVVSTIGRPAELGRLIESLRVELERGPTVELVVVDQSADGCCLEVLQGLERHGQPIVSWRYLRSGPGVSHGRNLGMAVAVGELIMFPDDDAWFDGETLAMAADHLARHPEHDGLCTQLQDGHGQPSMLRWSTRAALVTKRNHHRTSIGSTMLFRHDAARSVGGFDEAVGPGAGGWHGSCEDADFLLRVIEGGGRIWYDPEVVMNHRDSRRDGGESAQAKSLSYGCGQGLLWRSHRFPLWLVMALALRRLAGGTLWSLRGRPDIGRAHRAWVRGCINGWLGRPPLDMDIEANRPPPPEHRPGPVSTDAPTPAEFGRSLSWRLLAAPIGTVATFALTTIIARTLGPAEVTVSYTLLAALMIGPILGRFGLNQWAVRDLAALRTNEDLATAVVAARRLAIAVVGPAAIAAPLISVVFVAGIWGGNLDVELALLATVILFAETWRLAIGDVLLGLGQTGWAAILAHQVRAVAVTGTVVVNLLLRPGRFDLHVLLWLMAAVSVTLVAAGLARLWTLSGGSAPSGERLDLGLLVRRGLPFLLVDLVVVVVARGDVWLAAPTLHDYAAARYGTASVVAALIGMPIGLASLALAPVVAGLVAQRQAAEIDRLVRSLATVVAYALVPVVIAVVFFGRWVLEAAYGTTYGEAHRYLLVLMVG
ncbi:MAG: glycosyltransferase, partial [Actinomycetota bacterium]